MSEYESVGWANFFKDGSGDVFPTEEICAQVAKRSHTSYFEVAVELFRRRKPVPERPSVSYRETAVTYKADAFVVKGRGLVFYASNAAAVLQVRPADDDTTVRALLDLPAATAKWEAEFGNKESK